MYISTSNTLKNKDGGNVTTQEVWYVSCLSLLPCRVLSAGSFQYLEGERKKAREAEKCVRLPTRSGHPCGGIAIQRQWYACCS